MSCALAADRIVETAEEVPVEAVLSSTRTVDIASSTLVMRANLCKRNGERGGERKMAVEDSPHRHPPCRGWGGVPKRGRSLPSAFVVTRRHRGARCQLPRAWEGTNPGGWFNPTGDWFCWPRPTVVLFSKMATLFRKLSPRAEASTPNRGSTAPGNPEARHVATGAKEE